MLPIHGDEMILPLCVHHSLIFHQNFSPSLSLCPLFFLFLFLLLLFFFLSSFLFYYSSFYFHPSSSFQLTLKSHSCFFPLIILSTLSPFIFFLSSSLLFLFALHFLPFMIELEEFDSFLLLLVLSHPFLPHSSFLILSFPSFLPFLKLLLTLVMNEKDNFLLMYPKTKREREEDEKRG